MVIEWQVDEDDGRIWLYVDNVDPMGYIVPHVNAGQTNDFTWASMHEGHYWRNGGEGYTLTLDRAKAELLAAHFTWVAEKLKHEETASDAAKPA